VSSKDMLTPAYCIHILLTDKLSKGCNTIVHTISLWQAFKPQTTDCHGNSCINQEEVTKCWVTRPIYKKRKTWPKGLTKDQTLQRPPLAISGNQTTMGCALAMFPLIFVLALNSIGRTVQPPEHLRHYIYLGV